MKLSKLRAALEENGVDALLITNGHSRPIHDRIYWNSWGHNYF